MEVLIILFPSYYHTVRRLYDILIFIYQKYSYSILADENNFENKFRNCYVVINN